jgi:hypothetical protein
MFKQFLLLFVFIFTLNAYGDEIGLRFNSAFPVDNTSLWAFPPSGSASNDYINGKMINLVYEHDITKNFFVEGALGYRSYNDLYDYSSMDYEISPGLKVQAGPIILRISEGFASMPSNKYNPITQSGYQTWDLVTHLGIGLKDPKTGIGIYLDHAHYSNGQQYNNPSLDYTGFQLSFPVNW